MPLEEDQTEYNCDLCQDQGFVEIMGEGEGFEWDVIGTKECECNEN